MGADPDMLRPDHSWAAAFKLVHLQSQKNGQVLGFPEQSSVREETVLEKAACPCNS